jgi:hypothetical protein
MNKTSVESTAQFNDFQEIKRRKRHISYDNSERAQKSTKSVPIPTAVKQPPKAVPTSKFSAPIRTNDKDTETAGAENTLPEQEAPRKAGRPPPITSTTNLIRLQSDLKDHVNGEYEFRNARNGNDGLFSHEIPPGEK